jgi:hypothetical protein
VELCLQFKSHQLHNLPMVVLYFNNLHTDSSLDVCSCVWICATEENVSLSQGGEAKAKKQESSVN